MHPISPASSSTTHKAFQMGNNTELVMLERGDMVMLIMHWAFYYACYQTSLLSLQGVADINYSWPQPLIV